MSESEYIVNEYSLSVLITILFFEPIFNVPKLGKQSLIEKLNNLTIPDEDFVA